MKNLTKLIAALITTGIIFTSCSSNFSIMKRHYTSGYYIDYTRNNKEAIPKVAGNVSTTVAATSQPDVAQIPAPSTNSAQPDKEKKASIATKLKTAIPKTISQVITKQNQLNRNGGINALTKESTTSLSQPNSVTTITQDGDRGEHAALSLLWLVIVIILILWLIGILTGGFGLGGLINLLLVIALILLILWLLRII
jgi:hypothetical protein